jgi:ribosomal protein S12
MRNYLLIALLLVSFFPAAAGNVEALGVASQNKGVLIREITINGFVLGDKGQFKKLFKPYRSKYLTPDDMDALLEKIRVIYERDGYKELVSITYQVIKHRLVFSALMTS